MFEKPASLLPQVTYRVHWHAIVKVLKFVRHNDVWVAMGVLIVLSFHEHHLLQSRKKCCCICSLLI